MNATATNLRRLVDLRHLVAYVRSGLPDLTNRQMAVLQTVALTEGQHTVRGLAGQLGVAKPVITRILNTFGYLGPAPTPLLRRVRDEQDRRNIFVELTPAGRDFLDRWEALRG